MKRIFERATGPVSHQTEYRLLYHLCDRHSFSHVINTNRLTALRESHVSVTYDPNKDGVFGYHHMDFKFVIDGQKIVNKYGAYPFDHHIRVGDQGMESLDERELRLNTKHVENFSSYHVGTVLLFNVFTRRSLQNLLYRNANDSYGKTDSPFGVEMLHKQIFELKRPVWVGRKGRRINDREMLFVLDAKKIIDDGGDFDQGLRDLADKYNIIDHSGKTLDRQMVIRQQMTPVIADKINQHFSGKRPSEIDPAQSKKLFGDILSMLEIGGNAKAHFVYEAEKANFFHPVVPPIEWTIVLRDIIQGDYEEATEAMTYLVKRNAHMIKDFDNNEDGMAKYFRHYGVMMA